MCGLGGTWGFCATREMSATIDTLIFSDFLVKSFTLKNEYQNKVRMYVGVSALSRDCQISSYLNYPDRKLSSLFASSLDRSSKLAG